jgi:Fe-S-cluster containining protein
MMSCKEGCSYCCVAPVGLTEFEAKYIAEKAGIAKLEEPRHIEKQHHYNRCPFLGTADQCEVYPWRPFNCRTLHALGAPE